MSAGRYVTVDGNEAAASVAHRLSEVIAIYPITPSSNMGELADEWSAAGKRNVWGDIPQVFEMQSEGGAAGTVHGALQAGALATTFTASQGLLLMIPNMYKIAGELTPFCMHVAARTLATHALSIFGDHSDVMACRQTGFAMLAAGSVQEAHDLALVAHAATLESRVPFLHFFDGFRSSHEVAKIQALENEDLLAMLDPEWIAAHRRRALSPEHPVVRGTAQNPDVFFQAREACNSFYSACPGIVSRTFERFALRTGRRYRLFDYVGHPEAERVVVMMGSGAEAAQEAIEYLLARGERVGLLKVRLFRPFAIDDFVAALPPTTAKIAVLDRTKEPGAVGEPMYLDIVAALSSGWQGAQLPRVVGGRYGLSSKEFTPAMVMGVFDELNAPRPRHGFTVGIVDDVTHTSLTYDTSLDIEPPDVVRAVFYGLGADGTVGANKNSIKIIGEETDNYAQGYFVYDSKKSGAVTVSHLRFGPRPIHSSYLIKNASFVACHQFGFLERLDVLELAAPGAVFLLNAPYPVDQIWQRLPRELQATILERKLQFYAIDAAAVAKESGLGGRINAVMQTCFFAISGVLPKDEAIAKIKASVEKTYGKKGAELVRRNWAAIDATLERLHRVPVPASVTADHGRSPMVAPAAPEFIQRVTAVMLSGKGDLLPVSAFPVDGTWPTGTSRWEKRAIAAAIPAWDAPLCIQCNKCVFVCPHAAIRAKLATPEALAGAPPDFPHVEFKSVDQKGMRYSLQVAPEDCTGCGLCIEVCPARDKASPKHKAINLVPLESVREREQVHFDYFLGLPELDRRDVKPDLKGSQFLEPLFEFSGACAGCGETPYVKLLTQLFGDRALIANATGCSSIYGGNLPTTPYTKNRDGRGPAWANSLFEDNAEFGLGFRLALDGRRDRAQALLGRLAPELDEHLVAELLVGDQSNEAGLFAQRARVAKLREQLAGRSGPDVADLHQLADDLVRRSVWIVGGDGWAYDIGFGGLDHVLASGRDVNVLVLDTEVYSNTGGQQSKATPLGAAAKFAAAGKGSPKKDLGLMAMSYGNVYVARIAYGAKDVQTVQTFLEAEAYPGPSLIIAYSPCIAHGYDMALSGEQQKLAVSSGVWPLYRFDPRRVAHGEPPLHMDSPPSKTSVRDYMRNEARFRMVEQADPERFKRLLAMAERGARGRESVYRQLAAVMVSEDGPKPPAAKQG